MALIHQLGDERDDPGLQDVADGLAGIGQLGEGRQRGELRRRLGDQPHGDLGDDAQRALRPDEQPLEVVPGHILDRPAAQMQHMAAGQHHIEPQNIVAGDAVFQTARAARVGRHVPADRALIDAGGIGRIEEAELLDRLLQIVGDDARLRHRQRVGGRDIQDPVHARHVQADRAGHRHRGASQPRRRAARHDRDAARVGDAQHSRHVLRRLRMHDDIRLRLQPRAVVGIRGQILRRGAHPVPPMAERNSVMIF